MIKRVRVVNFKSLGDVKVDLDPVTVLIGRSGTGKTTFVEALRFLRDYVTYRGDQALELYGGWGKVTSATAQRPVSMSFEITFTVPGNQDDYQYQLAFRQEIPPTYPSSQVANLPFSLHEERLSLGTGVLYHQSGGNWVVPPKSLEQPAPGSLILGSISGIPEVTFAYVHLTSGLGWYAFPDTVLLPADAPPQFDRRAQLGQATHEEQTGLWDNGTNYLKAFAGITNNLRAWVQQKEMVAALQRVNRSVAGLEIKVPNKDAIVVSHKFNGAFLAFELGQESEGLRRFLAFLIALYQTPPKETLIFEEPEKGIHPGALAVLADQFKACAAEGRGQIILTTHSPELLNHFGPDTLRVVDIENNQTRIGPVAPEQVESIRERLLFPGELLTVDPARVANATKTES